MKCTVVFQLFAGVELNDENGHFMSSVTSKLQSPTQYDRVSGPRVTMRNAAEIRHFYTKSSNFDILEIKYHYEVHSHSPGFAGWGMRTGLGVQHVLRTYCPQGPSHPSA